MVVVIGTCWWFSINKDNDEYNDAAVAAAVLAESLCMCALENENGFPICNIDKCLCMRFLCNYTLDQMTRLMLYNSA